MDDISYLSHIEEPLPEHIQSFYNSTGRDRSIWDFETLLMMLISQARMRVTARKPDCEAPYTSHVGPVSEADEAEISEQITSSFFSRFKSK